MKIKRKGKEEKKGNERRRKGEELTGRKANIWKIR